MIRQFIIALVLAVTVTACSTTQIAHQSGINRITSNSIYTVDTNREEFNRQVAQVISNRAAMTEEQQIILDKRNKPQITGFMEQTKISMQLCQAAIDSQAVVKETMLIACEPFFRDLETARYGDNEKVLRRYGMGGKIALAVLAGAAGAAMYNSGDWGTIMASGTVMVTAASIASIPNDWNVISPYMSKVEANAYNKWLVLHINDQVNSVN